MTNLFWPPLDLSLKHHILQFKMLIVDLSAQNLMQETLLLGKARQGEMIYNPGREENKFQKN